MRNAEIADAMAELGTLYELDGANRFRVIAYKEAARVIRQSPVSIEELALAGKATELPGIGDTLQEKIVALAKTGEIPAATKLKAKYPASLIEVTRIPGLGAKTVRKLYDELGVSSLDELRAAAEGEQIRGAQGPRPEGRGERARGAGEARRGGAGRAAAALRRAPGGRGAGGGAARPSGLARRSRSPARRGGGPRPARTST